MRSRHPRASRIAIQPKEIIVDPRRRSRLRDEQGDIDTRQIARDDIVLAGPGGIHPSHKSAIPDEKMVELRAIAQGARESGGIVNISRLASKWGVSRDSVRRALRRIEGALGAAGSTRSRSSLSGESPNGDSPSAPSSTIGNPADGVTRQGARAEAQARVLRAIPIALRVRVLRRLVRSPNDSIALKAIELANELSGIVTRQELPDASSYAPLFALPKGTRVAIRPESEDRSIAAGSDAESDPGPDQSS